MGNLAQLQAASKAASPLIGQPLGQYAQVVDVSTAVNSDESAIFGSGTTGAFSDVSLTALTAPNAPTVTQGGTVGATNYSYIVADISNVGAAPSTATQTTTGNATLSATNFNIVQATGLIPGHTYYIYRSASSGTPSGLGLLATYTVPVSISTNPVNSTFTVNDTGQSATTADVPSANSTGALSIPGPAFVGATISGGGAAGFGGKVIVNGAGNVTYTAAQFLADIIVRTGGTAPTDPTPTAALLVAAAGPGVRAGATHRLEIRNEGGGTETLSAGTGVTLRAGNTNTIATVASRFFTIVFTTITAGSEAVELISGPTSAY